jgi:hypothetical protein
MSRASRSNTTGPQTVLTALCPAPAQLAAAAAGEEAGVRLHALGCPVCGPLLHDQESLRALGQALTTHTTLADTRRRSLAASVLALAEAQDDANAKVLASAAALPPQAQQETQEIVLIDPLGDIQLAARKRSQPRWRRPLMIGAMLAAAAVVALVVRSTMSTTAVVPRSVATVAPPAPAAAEHATVTPVGQASFQMRNAAIAGGARQVMVDSGTIEVDGNGGATMDVVGANIVIRSNGARMQAVASHGVVTSVAVFAGSVEIVASGKAAVTVSAGETWSWEPESNSAAASVAPTPVAPTPVAPTPVAPTPVAPVAPTPVAPVAPTPVAPTGRDGKAKTPDLPSPTKNADALVDTKAPALPVAPASAVATSNEPSPFETGFVAMRAGQWRAAATAFAKVVDDPSVGEDATYWCATALAKVGDAELSRSMYSQYLERFPSGSRAGESHVALGRLLLGSERAKARMHFDAAAQDRNPSVRAAATLEIDRLRKQALADDVAQPR